MVQFAQVFPDEEIVVSLIRQLSWTHIIALIPIEDPLKREFYTQMCILENWSVRTFRERIQFMLFERTAIRRKPECTINNEQEQLKTGQKVTPDLVFCPYRIGSNQNKNPNNRCFFAIEIASTLLCACSFP